MGQTLLYKVRRMNWVLQESMTGAFSFSDLARILSELCNSNVYIIDAAGMILGVCYTIRSDSVAATDPETGRDVMPKEYNDEFMKIVQTQSNLKGEEAMKIFKFEYDTYDKLNTIVPIMGGTERVGTLVLSRYAPEFNDGDLILGEYGATVVGLEIKRIKKLSQIEEERVKNAVQKAIGTLSFSETLAVRKIFEELGGDEGLLVASTIAARSGITRSGIVNALRKLESAGVIESRSLGMKGTHIKILNDQLIHELSKVKF